MKKKLALVGTVALLGAGMLTGCSEKEPVKESSKIEINLPKTISINLGGLPGFGGTTESIGFDLENYFDL